MAKKKNVVAATAAAKEVSQIAECLAHYAKFEQSNVENGLLLPFITTHTVPPQFDIRHIRYIRNRQNDIDVLKAIGSKLALVTDADFEIIEKGGKVARMNYGVTASDSAMLANNLNAAKIEGDAKDREIAELKKQLAASAKSKTE